MRNVRRTTTHQIKIRIRSLYVLDLSLNDVLILPLTLFFVEQFVRFQALTSNIWCMQFVGCSPSLSSRVTQPLAIAFVSMRTTTRVIFALKVPITVLDLSDSLLERVFNGHSVKQKLIEILGELT